MWTSYQILTSIVGFDNHICFLDAHAGKKVRIYSFPLWVKDESLNVTLQVINQILIRHLLSQRVLEGAEKVRTGPVTPVEMQRAEKLHP